MNYTILLSALFSYCSSVTMKNVYVNVSSNDTTELIGMYMVNVAESEIINVKVQVNILMCHNHPVTISGLSIYNNHRLTKVQLPGVIFEAFNYYAPKSYLKYSQCAIMCKIFIGPFGVIINNTVFANLSNSSALYFFGSTDTQGAPFVIIANTTVMYNTGFSYSKMLCIELSV